MLLEAVVVAALAAAALLGVALPGLRPGRRRVAAGAIALATGAGLGVAALELPRGVPEREVTNRPIQLSEDGYVSSSACRSCHPSNHASWHASWHRTMTQVATPGAVLGDFADVVVHAWGQTYRLERRGDEFWVEMEEAGSPGATTRRVARRILVTTGSHHEQDYWYETGHTRRLGFLPLTWLVEQQRWVPFDAVFLMPPTAAVPPADELDRWHSACIKCHATHGKPRTRPPDENTRMDTTVAEFGIACEACHGPAREHVRVNRSPLRRYRLHLTGAPDPTIVNPARLPPRRASQVCGQCHGIHKPLRPLPRGRRTPDDWREHGLAYRPGDDLEASRYLVQVAKAGEQRLEEIRVFDPHLLEDRFWPDGMVRVSGREYNGLVESPCFRGASGERRLGCLSCHAMHRQSGDRRPLADWADDQLKPGFDGDRACLQCHERYGEREARIRHTHHAPDSSGSRCMNCHMPYTTYGLLKAIRSHQVSSPSVSESRDAGRPNACNQCHLDRSLRWAGAHLATWYGQAQPEIPPVLAAVPLSVVWGLGGDAGQRALVAWSLGWEPAMQASARGDPWMAQLLAQLLLDPYDAVRLLAWRSLRRQPGFEDFEYDYVGPASERREAAFRAARRWRERRRAAGRPADLGFLIEAGSAPLPDRILERIHAQRNDRRVWLRE